MYRGANICRLGNPSQDLPRYASLVGQQGEQDVLGPDVGLTHGACTKPRGITEEQLVKGATIVGAAKVVEQVVAGARTIAFAG